MQKITPCLWFNDNAHEAVNFYISIFKNSKINTISYYGEAGSKASGRKKGSVMTIMFQLDGQEFMALNGGPGFKFSPAISLVINCKTQKEIDQMWNKLLEGGQEVECGWLTDKFGLSWQFFPTIVQKMLTDKDPKKRERVMEVIIKMNKPDIKTFKRAFNQ